MWSNEHLGLFSLWRFSPTEFELTLLSWYSKPKSSDFPDTGLLAPNMTLVSITNGPCRGWGLRDRKAEPRHGLAFPDAAFRT